MIHIYIANNFSVQIEDLSQQAQVAAAEKFKEPPVAPPAEAGGSTTVRYDIFVREGIIEMNIGIIEIANAIMENFRIYNAQKCIIYLDICII